VVKLKKHQTGADVHRGNTIGWGCGGMKGLAGVKWGKDE